MSHRESTGRALPEYETVSTLFYKLTSPASNGQVDRDLLAMFCQKIDCEPAGRAVALQVMVHKIQSPCEAEALIALEVLKACVESCDLAFRQEIGKFKFLNELIKVLSPKYLGSKSTDKVKKRVSELFYSWTLLMPTQPKIAEAYRLLKKQNLIVGHPDRQSYQEERSRAYQHQRMSSIFSDTSRTRRIAELLKSTHPDDILEANRLIKRMAHEDEIRTTRLYERSVKVRSIRTSAQVLDEMIDNFDPERDSFDIVRLLYDELKQNSLALQEMATTSDEADDRLGEVLEVNDLTLHVLRRFEESKLQERATILPSHPAREDVNVLVDLTLSQPPLPAPDLITESEADKTQSLVDDALSGIFAQEVKLSDEAKPDNTDEESQIVILRDAPTTDRTRDATPNLKRLSVDDAKDLAFLELDRAAAEIVDNELSKTMANDALVKPLPELLSSVDVVTEEPQSLTQVETELSNLVKREPIQTAPKVAPTFTLKISDFRPVDGSKPKKLLERRGLRLTIFEGQRLELMSEDTYLILLTLENHGSQHVTDLEVDFGEDVQILQQEGTKVGELIPFNPVLPPCSYVQLYLLRLTRKQTAVEVNLSYKVNSDRHFLHAECTLSG